MQCYTPTPPVELNVSQLRTVTGYTYTEKHASLYTVLEQLCGLFSSSDSDTHANTWYLILYWSWSIHYCSSWNDCSYTLSEAQMKSTFSNSSFTPLSKTTRKMKGCSNLRSIKDLTNQNAVLLLLQGFYGKANKWHQRLTQLLLDPLNLVQPDTKI